MSADRVDEFTYAGLTQKGLVRKKNEDAILMLPEENLFVVADGMGGHPGGDVASNLAVDMMAEFFERHPPGTAFLPRTPRNAISGIPEVERLTAAIAYAHNKIRTVASGSPELRGMGTTITAAHLVDSVVVATNVGDSSCDLFSGERSSALSRTHRTTEWATDIEMRQAGLPLDGPRPCRHLLTQYLGHQGSEMPPLAIMTAYVYAGDMVILCTDGIHDFADYDAFCGAIRGTEDPQQVCDDLIELALEGGSTDDLSVVAVRQDREFVPFEAPAHIGGTTEPLAQYLPILHYHRWRSKT